MPIDDLLPDVVTETTTVGWGDKLLGSIKGFLFGFVLVGAAGVGLFWNEGRAVQTQKSLTEGSGQVIHVDAERVLPDNEGKLIHVAGPVKTGAALADPEFNVQAQGLLLVRRVEMFQWKEEKETKTEKHYGGSEERVTTYTYSKVWSSSRQDSNHFKQRERVNPQMRYQGRTMVAKDAQIGAFRPSERVLMHLAGAQNLPLDQQLLTALRQRYGANVHVLDDVIYLSADPSNPAIGDLRISYQLANPSTLTIVGRQTDNGFTSFQTKAGDALLFVKAGTVEAAKIFADAQRENRILTWALRAVGLVVMAFGFMLIMGPLVALADVIPPLGSLLGIGAGFIALVLTALIGPLVIAVAWFWYRPLVSIIVIAVGLAAAFGFGWLAPRRKTSEPAGAPAGAQPAA